MGSRAAAAVPSSSTASTSSSSKKPNQFEIKACDSIVSRIGKDRPPMPPKEPAFTCPICMSALVEEMTTKCGHIFCKACIKAALAVQAKCPTCRKHTTSKDIIRIYLPK